MIRPCFSFPHLPLSPDCPENSPEKCENAQHFLLGGWYNYFETLSKNEDRPVYTDKLNAALTYIDDNLSKTDLISDLAGILSMSETGVRCLFPLVTGKKLSEYVRLRRLSAALYDLKMTDDSIADIAERYGYKSHAAFSRAFREMEGMSPGEARESDGPLTFWPGMRFPDSGSQLVISPYREDCRESMAGPFHRLSEAVKAVGSPPADIVPTFVGGSVCKTEYGPEMIWTPGCEDGVRPGTHYPLILKTVSIDRDFRSAADFGTPFRVSGIILQTADDTDPDGMEQPDNWKLWGSDDGTDWHLIARREGQRFGQNDYAYFAARLLVPESYRFYRFTVDVTNPFDIALTRVILCTEESTGRYEDAVAPAPIRNPVVTEGTASFAEPETSGSDRESVLRTLGLRPYESFRFIAGAFGIGDDTGPENLWDPDTCLPYESFQRIPFSLIRTEGNAPLCGIMICGTHDTPAEKDALGWQLIGSDDRENWTVLAQGDGRFFSGRAGDWNAARFRPAGLFRWIQFQFYGADFGRGNPVMSLSAVVLLTSLENRDEV